MSFISSTPSPTPTPKLRASKAEVTDRHALHLAQVIQMAMRDGRDGTAGQYPEQGYLTPPATLPARGLAVAGAGVLAAGAALAWGLSRRGRTG